VNANANVYFLHLVLANITMYEDSHVSTQIGSNKSENHHAKCCDIAVWSHVKFTLKSLAHSARNLGLRGCFSARYHLDCSTRSHDRLEYLFLACFASNEKSL